MKEVRKVGISVVKCENGHWFDGNAYTTCPHCGAAVADKKETSEVNVKKNKKEKKSKTESRISSFGQNSVPAPVVSVPKTVKLDVEENKFENQSNSGKTMDIWQKLPSDNYENNTDEQIQSENNISEPVQAKNLASEIKKASAMNEGKTMGYFSALGKSSHSSNDAAQTNVGEVNKEPVVGWLVAISGAHFGQSFCLAAGKNTIGRNADNNIVLNKDNSVSREKHAIVIYEPKKRNFYVQPGDSSGLTYLNDEYIEETHAINDKDIIEIGDTKIMFISLCGENFTWEDYISKEN